MSSQGHARPTELAALLAGEKRLNRHAQLGIALHLAKGCDRCWKALDDVPIVDVLRNLQEHQECLDHVRTSLRIRRYSHKFDPAYWRIPFFSPLKAEARVEPSSWPLLRAFRRVGFSRSWPTLRSGHLETVRSVRDKTWGFAQLLIEEAALLIDERSPGQCCSTRLLELPRQLVDALIVAEPGRRVGGDLQARLELAHLRGLTFERPEGMPQALERARQHLREGTGAVAGGHSAHQTRRGE